MDSSYPIPASDGVPLANVAVGFGDVSPALWWSTIPVVCEVALAVVFTTTIFSKALGHFAGDHFAHRADEPERDRTRTIQ